MLFMASAIVMVFIGMIHTNTSKPTSAIPTPTVTVKVTLPPKVIVKTLPPPPPRTVYVTRASRSSTRSTHKRASGATQSTHKRPSGGALDLRHKDFWLCVHGRESSNWFIHNGYEGGLQFMNGTWLSAGGAKFAQHAYDATPDEQITVANWMTNGAHTGLHHNWPNTAPPCAIKVGLEYKS